MSKQTKYTVTVGGEAQDKTWSKKAQAVEAAEAARKETRSTVTVATEAGTVVFELAGVRPMKRTPQYSREVELPEGFVIPEGLRPAYTRARKNLVILHDPAAEEGAYSVVNFVTGETLAAELATTRDAGAFCKTVPVPVKAEPEPANA